MDNDSTAVLDEPIVRTYNPPPKNKSQAGKPKQLPPYMVVVYNDDDHTFDYVIMALQKVFGYDVQKAFLYAVVIDRTGQANVWSGSKEVAELKKDQLDGIGPDLFGPKKVEYPLHSTIEPMA